jgi:hypothetical protein
MLHGLVVLLRLVDILHKALRTIHLQIGVIALNLHNGQGAVNLPTGPVSLHLQTGLVDHALPTALTILLQFGLP